MKRQQDEEKDINGVLHSISIPSPTLCETKIIPEIPLQENIYTLGSGFLCYESRYIVANKKDFFVNQVFQ